MEIVSVFGKVLRKLRLKAGLTQEQLGLDADIRRTYISLIELGQNQPTLSTIFKLSAALKISPSKFIKLVEDEIQKN
jgi:transcriptional regulator with XRE-family HTH domain